MKNILTNKIIISIITIILVILGTLVFFRIKKAAFCENNFSGFFYTTKDFNFIKNYKEFKVEDEKRKEIFKELRGEFANKNAKDHLDLGENTKNNQGVHPDIVKLNRDNRDKYYLAYTPYPFGKDKYENPCIVVSDNGIDFAPENGVTNPLVPTPDDYSEGGHLSDTDMLYNEKTGKFMMYYVYNKKKVLGGTKIYLIDSSDGIKWSEPQVIYDTREGYSPAVVQEDNGFKMWHVESEGRLVRSPSEDGYKWTTFTDCNIDMGDWLIWHIDIKKTDIGYEALICARNPELKTRALFYGLSKDGLNWKTSKKPILFPSESGWDSKEIYRSTFLKENGKYRVWYSARGDFQTWNIGYTEYNEKEIKDLELR